MEFLESHTGKNMKAVWRNDISVPENASDESDGSDDGSDGNDDNSEDNEDKGENENKEKKKEDQEEEKEKIADKVMTDLEVCCYLYIIIEYDINYSD